VGLADEFRRLESELPPDWAEARLRLSLSDPAQADRAAALLGPLAPGRSEAALSFSVAPRGAGPLPELARRLLARLDAEGIAGTLEIASSRAAEAPAAAERASLAATWAGAVAGLPPDWSDVYAELELTSTDHLERGALLTAPLNPARHGDRPAFRFRCARRFGYGASPGMVHRCLERLDEERIRGDVRILHALSDTHPVGTQGPVWRIGSRSV
jgi:hypothetical protein